MLFLVYFYCVSAGSGLDREVGRIFVGEEEGEEGQALEHDGLRPFQGGSIKMCYDTVRVPFFFFQCGPITKEKTQQ